MQVSCHMQQVTMDMVPCVVPEMSTNSRGCGGIVLSLTWLFPMPLWNQSLVRRKSPWRQLRVLVQFGQRHNASSVDLGQFLRRHKANAELCSSTVSQIRRHFPSPTLHLVAPLLRLLLSRVSTSRQKPWMDQWTHAGAQAFKTISGFQLIWESSMNSLL